MIPISDFIDHTLLGPTASETDIRKICEEAWIHQFKAICVAPSYVTYAVEMLEFCPVKIEIATVIGFPFGYSTTRSKVSEASDALQNGATELDVVMNISRFKSMAYLSVREELRMLSERTHEKDALLKVIVETTFLDSFELYTAAEICAESGADFMVTATGMAGNHSDEETVRKLKMILPPHVRIKAAGEILTHAQARAFIDAGASRIGTASGISIVSEL
ncbi:deoxyribose-phosphate aldolase [Dyadobacter sediminis]|uniref:Deoxyribose-phosphate aldolase n=1 Tax=Dyadobacter sediminis TaxID=1493691 RepID=A0A5R9K5X2_9BACT|nr:deoxyribose-phosphate aldolase [Dyadobacter sediminis]TLU89049.1 deoxyribose-phosphate aldolase [Dyadobacter sediminis]GGC03228.1 2-deoxyribose-5-phosphate aldolase [Dyadobacter sediminis]